MGGLFGVISKKKCTTDLFYGTDYHSHLGTKRGGMAVYNGDGTFARDIHNLESSYFRIKFEEDLHKYTGNSGVGVISDTDAQPIIFNSHLGKFAIVTVGRINNLEEIEKELLSNRKNFTEVSMGKTNPTEIVANLITEGATFAEGIEIVQRAIKGSCSFLILTEDSLIACRDYYGRTPLVLGKNENGYAVASESCSFSNIGYELIYDIKPGEALHITDQGYKTIIGTSGKNQICSFLWIYYGYPVSNYEGINVDNVRYNLGYNMGHSDKEDVEVVSAIPDSGTCMAIGYSQGKNIPYRCAIVKYTPTWPRSFTPTDQSVRQMIAKMKLMPNNNLIKEKKIVFCDDSIVRGTQLKDNVKNLYAYGAKEVHIRISCPPIIFSCEFVNFSASRTPLELITRRYIQTKEGDNMANLSKYVDPTTQEHKDMVNYIKETLHLDSLKFNSVQTLIDSIGLPKESVCTYCFDGSGCGHQ